MNYLELREGLIEYMRPDPGRKLADILAMLFTIYEDLSIEKGGAKPIEESEKASNET